MGFVFGSPNRARTCDIMINSHALYRLSYRGKYIDSEISESFVLASPYLPGPLPVEYFRHRTA